MRDQIPTNGGRPTGVRKIREPVVVDLKAERTFLGGCILKPDLILSSGVVSSDFSSAMHARIWDAILWVHAEGEAMESVTVRARLEDLGHHEAGEQVIELLDTLPQGDFPARRVRKLARLRALHEAARVVSDPTHLLDDEARTKALARFDKARAEHDNGERGPAVPTFAEAVLAMRAVGRRLKTGLDVLDEATRGGIPLGRFIGIVGAPGASKTNYCAGLAWTFLCQGCAVCFVAADEARDSVLVRFGQLAGFHRDAVEDDHLGAREELARRGLDWPLLVPDPREDRVTLEDCERLLVAIAGDRPRVILVDSLQKVKCEAARVCETRREEIDVIVDVLDGMCARGTLVVAISEMSRAGYRSGNKALDISALAASAESRAIEYAAHLLLGLRPVKKERGQVDIEIAKNRLGNIKTEFRVQLDEDRLTWSPVEVEEDSPVEAAEKSAAILRNRVLEAAKAHPCKTITALARKVVGKKTDKLAMIKELLEDQSLAKIGDVIRPTPKGGQ